MAMESARIAIEVVAGIIPEQPLGEYTKRWIIPSSLWYSTNSDDIETARNIQLEAIEYQKSLMNPAFVNWVRLDWIYF